MEVKLGEAEKGISSIEKKEQTYPIFWEEYNKVCGFIHTVTKVGFPYFFMSK